jgi:hypothetical protein
MMAKLYSKPESLEPLFRGALALKYHIFSLQPIVKPAAAGGRMSAPCVLLLIVLYLRLHVKPLVGLGRRTPCIVRFP